MFKLLLALVLVSQVLTVRTLNKVIVNHPDARCLDGSPPAYYISRGTVNRYLLSFEGGGWCGSSQGLPQTIESCYQRSKTALGSSTSYAATMSASVGVLSDSEQSPFRNWTIVHMKYCDGTGHQGYKTDPVSYKDTKLYFRGHAVTIGQLQSVDNSTGMFKNAQQIVVTGQSAGGLATFLWTEYIVDRAKGIKVWSMPDSGIFLDSINYNTKTHAYRDLFQNFMKLSNEQIDPPSKNCSSFHSNQKWKCMFAQYNHYFIVTPIFCIQSLYDSWSIHYILGMECQADGAFTNCDKAHLSYIEEYHANTTAVLRQIVAKNINSCWAPACSNHVYSTGGNYANPSFEVPHGSPFTLAYSLNEWVRNKQSGSAHIDEVSWPGNKPCSGIKLVFQQ